MASALGETGPALEHAQQVAAIAAEHPNAYLRVFALAAQGLSATIRGDLDAAIAAYGESLASLRASRAAMEYESELLASLAECHLRSRHRAAALETALQALAVAQAQTTRLPQCRACLVLAVLAMESELPDGQEPQTLLTRAEQLIERTGAAIYLPQLNAARTRIAVSGS
jgi:hypothetical protein